MSELSQCIQHIYPEKENSFGNTVRGILFFTQYIFAFHTTFHVLYLGIIVLETLK